MKKRLISSLSLLVIMFTLSGCVNTLSNIWEDTKTASRYINRKGRSLFNGNTDSRLVANNYEFYANQEEDFIPLRDQDLETGGEFIETAIPQPKVSPGAPNSKVPGIEAFYSPTSHLKDVFRVLHFHTDKHTLMTQDDEVYVRKMAQYLKKHPSTYVFIAGHCDERASEAYNLALGTRRANHIRYLLIKNGANANQLYTISFGKEKPCSFGHAKSDWAKNRRVEFKLYDKQASV